MTIRRAVLPTTLLIAGAAALSACGSYASYSTDSAGSSKASTTVAKTSTSTKSSTGAPTATAGTDSKAQPTGSKQDANLPKVTKVDAPTGVTCEPGATTVDFTVRYTVVNAERIEYLRPGADRPGADDATGSLVLTYDCTQPQQTFHIRAFNEFADNGSDAKDPSPYVSFPVTRNGKSTSTTKPAGSSTKKSSAPAPRSDRRADP